MATISFTMYSIVVNNEDTMYGYHLLHHVQYVSSLFTTILYMVKEMVAIHRVFIIHDDTVHG
jgi:ABC-type multidrug transport system permease subunit